MFHAEMIPPITDSVGDAVQQSAPPLAPHGSLTSYSTFLESRPPAFETYAVEEIVTLAKLASPKLHLHIVHLSATEVIPILRKARAKGVNITAETCFHYLGLHAEAVKDGDTRHKCCPPIRARSNQDGLWAELVAEDSCIRTIVSDHSPCTPELKLLPEGLEPGAHGHDQDDLEQDMAVGSAMHHSDSGVDMTLSPALAMSANKVVDPTQGSAAARGVDSKKLRAVGEETDRMAVDGPKTEQTDLGVSGVADAAVRGNFFAAWGGISSVGLGLPILHTAIQHRRREDATAELPSIVDIVRLTSQSTARQVGLSHRKGGLKPGLDADVCVFDDSHVWTLRNPDMKWRNKCSPWEGHEFVGRVVETWLRGAKIFELGAPGGGFAVSSDAGAVPVPRGEAIIERRTS